MTTKSPLNLVFLWHMHQPDYRNHSTGEIILPWVLLHSLKDYSDMAYHLEINSKMRAVVNFVPILCEQIEDYKNQFQNRDFRLPLLKFLNYQDLNYLTIADKKYLLENCFSCNEQNMIKPYFAYFRLWEISKKMIHANDINYLSANYFGDILTWYFLVWLGESIRRTNPLFQILVDIAERGVSFSFDDRQKLISLMGETITNLLQRYQNLQERGQIEISTTPKAHPLAPLMLDFKTAHDTVVDAPIPTENYPHGASRVNAHVQEGLAIHKKYFNSPAKGMWPAEGAISEEFINTLSNQPIAWLASGEGVLKQSINKSKITPFANINPAYSPWRFNGNNSPILFFRDERLSDMIGFEYSKWHSGEAARHLVGQIEGIYDNSKEDTSPVVGIMLDGENAWEHYPFNGYYFFETLYQCLSDNSKIHVSTFSTICEEVNHGKILCQQLPKISAGSWVYGNLTTWIGDVEKNRGWELLINAKKVFDVNINLLTPEEAKQAYIQLSICESSDWFWWFGGYNPSQSVISFDKLYRQNLSLLYMLLKVLIPEELSFPISKGNTENYGDGTMRKTS